MINNVEGKEQQGNRASELYELSLTQTINEDNLNEHSIANLAQTLADDELNQVGEGKEILSILLETLDDGDLENKFVDFYVDDNNASDAFDRLASTQDESWSQHFDASDYPDIGNDLDNFIPGHYKINGFIGSDHNGHIFSAQDNNLERHIIVKFLKKTLIDDSRATEEFINQAKNAATVTYPGALPVHNINFTDGGLPFYTMRKSTLTVSDLLERSREQMHPLIKTIEQRIEIILQICLTINDAHDHNVIHRDIKPSNIIIQEHGGIYLSGWANSHTAGSNINNQPNHKIGTPMYMSPEQAKNELCDKLSDIYCIGTSLLHLLTLRYPLFRSQVSVFWEMKQNGELDPLTEDEVEEITAPLAAIVNKCTHKNRSARYQSIMDLHADLKAFLYNDVQSISALNPSLSPKKITWVAGITTAFSTIILALMLVYANGNKDKPDKLWPVQYADDFANNKTRVPDSSWNAYYLTTGDNPKRTLIDWNDQSSWRVENNALIPQPIHSNNQQLNTIYRKALINDQYELEFDVIGFRAKPIVNIIVNGLDRDTGYSFQFQDTDTPQVSLYKKNKSEPLATVTLAEQLQKNKTYTFLIKREHDLLTLSIDNKIILHTTDPIPLYGPKKNFIAFESNSLNTQIRNIVIKAPPPPGQINTIKIADHLYNSGSITLALTYYDNLRIDHRSDTDISSLALLRSGICLHTLGQIKEASIRLESFLHLHPQHRLSFLAHKQLSTIYKMIGNEKKVQYHRQFELAPQIFNQSNVDIIIRDVPNE